MSRMKLTLVAAVVAAFAIAATSAAASAHEYVVNGSPVAEKTNLASHLFAGNFVLSGKPFTVAVHIECSKVQESGSINTGGTGTAKLEFSTCTVEKPGNCTVKTPITTEVNTTLPGATETEFKPKGAAFTTITLEGASCSLKEPFAVTGSQACALPGAETSSKTHEISCAVGGSKLKAGGAAATFSGTISGLELESGLNWNTV